MPDLVIEADTKQLLEALEAYPKRAERASVRALNRAAKSAKTVMARAIAKDLGIKVGAVNKRISISKASIARFFVKIGASLRRIPLTEFGARGPVPSRGRGRGVSYRLPGGRGRLPHGFIATMPSGHKGVYTRKTTRRLPITEHHGPSIGHVFAKHSKIGLARAQEQFAKNLKHELRFMSGGGE
jgi:hypothetical protein